MTSLVVASRPGSNSFWLKRLIRWCNTSGPRSSAAVTVPGVIIVRITYALWVLQTMYLTVTAFTARRDTRTHLGQSFGLLFMLIAAFVLPRMRPFRFVNFAPVNRAVSLVGLVVCAAGMAFLVWARQTLGKNWSQSVAAKVDPELVTSGPYRFVRHPIYAGGLLACIASPSLPAARLSS